MYMHMLDPYVLIALTPFPRQGFDLHRVRAHKFVRQVAEHIQPFDAVTFVSMACDGAACTSHQFEQDNIRHSHVRCQHCFDFVMWPYSVNDGEGGIERKLIGTTGIKIVVQRMVPVAFSKPLSIQRTNCRERVPNASASR